MILPIKVYPDKILRQKAKKVADVRDVKLQQLILNMSETMKEKDGIGLAAPQVGENLRIIVINTQDGVLALINPRILIKSLKREEMEEGCLSFPKIFGIVRRPVKILISALNKDGKRVRFTAKGFLARVIQHEVDHLNGILFIDKVKKITKGERELEELKKLA
jgi:peptide deformylase